MAWPLSEDLDDAPLKCCSFRRHPEYRGISGRCPIWAGYRHRRPDVTLALLWEETRAGAADGFGYSWFCDSTGPGPVG